MQKQGSSLVEGDKIDGHEIIEIERKKSWSVDLGHIMVTLANGRRMKIDSRAWIEVERKRG